MRLLKSFGPWCAPGVYLTLSTTPCPRNKSIRRRYFLAVLRKRLAELDCEARGWVLDGFPHTKGQCEELEALGIVPDKVRMGRRER